MKKKSNLKVKNGMLVILPAHPSFREQKNTIVSITEKGTSLKRNYLTLCLGAYGLSLNKDGQTLASTFGSLNGWPDIGGKVKRINDNTLLMENYGEIQFFPINYENDIINEIRIFIDRHDELFGLKSLEMLVPNDVKYMSHLIKNDPGSVCDQRVLYKMQDGGGIKKYLLPGVKTHKSGKYVVPTKEALQCYSTLTKICYTNNLDLIIRQYFPEGSGDEIKKILKVKL